MDILTEWLRSSESDKDVGPLIDRLSHEIEQLESQIRVQLKLKDGEKYPYIFRDFSRFLGDTTVKIIDIDSKFTVIEEDTCQKTRNLKNSLVTRQKILEDSQANKKIEKDQDQDTEEDFSHLKLIESYYDELFPKEVAEKYYPLDKLALKYLLQAKDLINEDLFPTVQVGSDSTYSSKTELFSERSIFSFSFCKVSKSIYNFIQLLREIISEASQNNEDQKHFIQAARDLCELYLVSFQDYRDTMVNDYHQYCAVNHNNCLYVAHNITVLPSILKQRTDEESLAVFVDMIPSLKEAAYSSITTRMKKDREIISEFFRCPEMVNGFSYSKEHQDKFLASFKKAFKQSISYISTIHNAWIEILPITVCNKLIATLVNYALSETIDIVLKLEDIAVDIAASLENIFEEISKDIANLMKDFLLQPAAIIEKWFQFQELKLIFQASLQDIVDRWADGQGPLAEAFSADRVKSLIRSLFQNTDRRSAALSKIR